MRLLKRFMNLADGFKWITWTLLHTLCCFWQFGSISGALIAVILILIFLTNNLTMTLQVMKTQNLCIYWFTCISKMVFYFNPMSLNCWGQLRWSTRINKRASNKTKSFLNDTRVNKDWFQAELYIFCGTITFTIMPFFACLQGKLEAALYKILFFFFHKAVWWYSKNAFLLKCWWKASKLASGSEEEHAFSLALFNDSLVLFIISLSLLSL